MHWNFANDANDVTVNLIENSSNGFIYGTVTYEGTEYPVTGFWQASGSVTGRVTSNLQLSGQHFTVPEAPDFVAVSGLIKGTAPNMGPMDLVVQAASSFTGQTSQAEVQLANSLQQPEPATVNPMPAGGTNIPWMLGSPDGRIVMNVQVGLDGTVSGKLTRGNEFSVVGQWAGRELAPGREASVFELMGQYPAAPNANDLLAVAGVVTGDYQAPQKIEIFGNAASISQYENDAFKDTLLPMSQNNITALEAAYAESYMVIRIGGDHGDSKAVNGWTGPTADGNGKPFGSSNYQSAGVEMNNAKLDAIVSPDRVYTDTNLVTIPAIAGATGPLPVMIQFIGDVGHFRQPPLREYHKNITKIFYDEQAGALVLQYAAKRGGSRSAQINFNQGRIRNHNSVIIEPF